MYRAPEDFSTKCIFFFQPTQIFLLRKKTRISFNEYCSILYILEGNRCMYFLVQLNTHLPMLIHILKAFFRSFDSLR